MRNAETTHLLFEKIKEYLKGARKSLPLPETYSTWSASLPMQDYHDSLVRISDCVKSMDILFKVVVTYGSDGQINNYLANDPAWKESVVKLKEELDKMPGIIKNLDMRADSLSFSKEEQKLNTRELKAALNEYLGLKHGRSARGA